MANRKRNIEVRFRVTQDELEMIHKKMAQYGTTNLSAFLRKMSIDGYVVKLELPELKEMVPCSGIPVITSTSSQNVSMKPAESMMLTWKISGKATNGCGTRHGIFSRPSQN